ncbi:hypothetical protein [Allocoleopsis franciscana]|uniref:Uncharacterized protein n=1 Tax=Allocoleopsis franciscana PCC 7113 TaxID=1173027 RepID=K9WAQ9_9CYAN|nr:hypothetical protein Mic7113_0961 [Allocoleopsis franciscana PCC 7113]
MGFPMITEEHLAKEFTIVVKHFYPKAGQLLRRCYVKVINSSWGRPPKRLQYIGIYCPDEIVAAVLEQRDVLREVAENMGLVEVVCMNATRLVRDPLSKIKHTDPRFWLELHWIAK